MSQAFHLKYRAHYSFRAKINKQKTYVNCVIKLLGYFFRVAPQATVYDSPSIGCSFSSSMDDPTTDSNGESHRVTFRIGSESSPSLSSNHQNSNSRKEQFLSCRQDSCSASVCSCSISGGSFCTSGSSCCTSGPSCRRRQQSSSMDSDFGIRTHDCDPQFQTKTSVDEFVSGRFRVKLHFINMLNKNCCHFELVSTIEHIKNGKHVFF